MIKRIGFWERLLLIFISVVCFVWFYQNIYQKVWEGKTVVLDDARIKAIINLRKDFDRGEAKKIRVYLFGEIDGTAKITLSGQTENPQEYFLKPGKIRLRIDREWKDPKCTLEYAPQNVGSGFLTLRYHFNTRRK